MMAYSLARFNTGGQHLAFWVLSQRFLPPVAIVLPIFLLFRGWHLYDTHVGLILVYTFMTLPLTVWMMYAYFRQLPKSLEEAALVDGLSRWQAFWMIAVPLAAPGHRRGGGVRLHRGLDRVLLRPDPDQPLRLHFADGVPRLPRLPGRAIRRGLRAGHDLAGSVDRSRHAGAAPSGARPDPGRAARMSGRWSGSMANVKIKRAAQELSARCTRCAASTSTSPTASSRCWSARPAAARAPCCARIAGLEEVDDGDDRDRRRGGERHAPARPRRGDGVPGLCALSAHDGVREHRLLSLRARRMRQAGDRAARQRAAGMLGITPLLGRYPRQLSGGQRQRVAIGRAIVRNPRVFLFDEPLSNLDAQLRDEMRSEIKRLHQEIATTMIYVTHDQIEAMTLADRIVLLRDGLIEQQGAPLDLFERPATLFVAGFLGSPQDEFPARPARARIRWRLHRSR